MTDFSSSHVSSAGIFHVRSNQNEDQSTPQIVGFSDGGFAVLWVSTISGGDSNAIYAQRYDAAGARVGEAFHINAGAPARSFDARVISGDRLVVSWGDTSYGDDVRTRLFSDTGVPLGDMQTVNTTTAQMQNRPMIQTLSDGGFVIAWESRWQDDGNSSASGLYAQRYDSAGAAVGDEFALNSFTFGDQTDLQMTVLPDGSLLAIWVSMLQDPPALGFFSPNPGVFGQIFDPSGQPTGEEFRIGSFTPGVQDNAHVVLQPGGGFVVVWDSADQDGSYEGVYAQRFSAAGIALEEEFRVNTYTRSSQYDSAVTALPGGGFVVAWTSSGQGNFRDGASVYAQRFAADGTALGGEFRVSAVVNGDQQKPEVVCLSDGSFLIGWEVYSSSSGATEFFARRYLADGTPLGSDFYIQDYRFDTGGAFDRSLVALANGNFAVAWDATYYNGSTVHDVFAALFAATSPFAGDELDNLITGTAGDNVMTGNAGNDTLDGGAGNDVFDGGAGVDTAIFAGAAAVTVNLTVLAAQQTGLGNDRFLGIENVIAGSGNDVVSGDAAGNFLSGLAGNDRLLGEAGNDTLRGGDGADTLNGGAGDDTIEGGYSAVDLRDIIYGGDGNDSIDAGYGNDLAFAGLGNDTVEGGFGADELNGQQGDDTLSGGALSDLIYGGDGFDFINGGFGYDRLNGGAGGDRFYHLGVRDHGMDWVQDYSAAQGDVLVAGIAGATRAQFLVQFSTTPGAGQAGVQEAFITYRPTGQVLWALIDGAGQAQINLSLGGQTFDLLA